MMPSSIPTDTIDSTGAANGRLNTLHQRTDQMMATLSARWQSDPVTQRRDQVRQGLANFGSKLQQQGQGIVQGSHELLAGERKLQLKESFQSMGSKFQQQVSFQKDHEPGLADQLGMFNERMKEEAMRRDVRREAEEACLQTMRAHLTEFLEMHAQGTYEEWIEDLHPENTQDLSLLQDMEYTEVDLRFYVEESDHRMLWNSMVKSDPQRQVAARSRMWGGSILPPSSEVVDLLGGDSLQPCTVSNSDANSNTVLGDPFGGDPFGSDPLGGDPFAASSMPTPIPKTSDKVQATEVDLLSF